MHSKTSRQGKIGRQEILETVAPDFTHDQPFSFLCNARLDTSAWTPERLRKELGITNFGRLKFVRAIVTPATIDEIIPLLIESWNEHRVIVHLVFPTLLRHPVMPTDTCLGLTARQIYSRSGSGWETSKSFKLAVKELFCDERLVRIG